MFQINEKKISPNRITILKLSNTQIWVVLRALEALSEDEQARKLCERFPNLDMDAFVSDLVDIGTQIELQFPEFTRDSNR